MLLAACRSFSASFIIVGLEYYEVTRSNGIESNSVARCILFSKSGTNFNRALSSQCAEEKSNESVEDMDRTFAGW